MRTAMARFGIGPSVRAVALAAVVSLAPAAAGQDHATESHHAPSPPPPTVQRGRGFGLGGVRAAFPGTNTINQTPPLERRGRSLLPPSPQRPDRTSSRPIVRIPDSGFRGVGRHDDRDHRDRQDHERHGSGFHLDGSFKDDDTKLHIHLGTDPIRFLPHRRVFRDDVRFVWPYSARYYDYYREPIDGYYDPAMVPVAVPEVEEAPPVDLASLTAVERAGLLMRAGEPEAAVAAYREHLEKSPDDASAMRSLAVALLAAKDPQVAAAVMALAYRTDPSLAERPIDALALPEGFRDLRKLVQRASVYANKSGGASAWLSLAVLMQGEGRPELAARMIDRAAKAGLDSALVERFRLALGVTPTGTPGTP